MGITVAGRKVLADLALPKDEVRALALDRAAGFRGSHERNRDRRNLYLVRPSTLFPCKGIVKVHMLSALLLWCAQISRESS